MTTLIHPAFNQTRRAVEGALLNGEQTGERDGKESGGRQEHEAKRDRNFRWVDAKPVQARRADLLA